MEATMKIKKYVEAFPNASEDELYRRIVSDEGLFHVFYGHKLTPKERARVNYIWKAILKYKKQLDPKQN
jgi:hypothetical protein